MKTNNILALFLMLLVCCNDQPSKDLRTSDETRENVMAMNFNNFIEEGWNNKDLEKFKSVSTENYVRHLNGIRVAGNQREMEANMNIFFTGFPDLKVSVEDIKQADNQLFARWTCTGTNTGVFGESPPTGKKIKVSGYSRVEFSEEGKMAQEDVYYNELELLQQLGYTLNPPIVE
jgi:steroid delta-isomerase-like uncharacterized protein